MDPPKTNRMEEEAWKESTAVNIPYHYRVRKVEKVAKLFFILQNWSPEKQKDVYTDRDRIRT